MDPNPVNVRSVIRERERGKKKVVRQELPPGHVETSSHTFQPGTFPRKDAQKIPGTAAVNCSAGTLSKTSPEDDIEL